VAVSGFGFWSGQDVTLEFHPAAENTGLVFVRRDLPGQPEIPARVAFRRQAERRTVIGHQRATVEMIEHVLAALSGLQIDNCRIVTSAAEMPGMDGSSHAFVEALDTAGVVAQTARRLAIHVSQNLRVGDDHSWIEARPAPGSRHFSIQYRLDYGADQGIATQTYQYQASPDRFRRELAAARTFILKHEADWLRAQGLAQRATLQDVLVFGPSGLIGNQLRYADECVRHKVLDVLGDFALAGCDLIGQFIAFRSGHRLNADLVERLCRPYPWFAATALDQPRRIAS
jgi:UDP-3-O-acyl N-acetylglucosamine deacetylase